MSYDNARHPSVQDDFHDVLLEQLKSTPWVLVSGGLHALLVIVLMLFVKTPVDLELTEAPQVAMEKTQEPEVIPEPIEPPEMKDPDPTLDPELTEVTVPELVDQTAADSKFEETVGASEDASPYDAKLTKLSMSDAIGLSGGIGGGARGRGGKRDGRRGGGFRRNELTVDRGLWWLARHQSADGSWDADGFSCQDGGCSCLQGSRGGPQFDTGVTGLALLAFLGAGETQRHGKHRKNVAKALRWLIKNQDGEGCFTSQNVSNFAYNQATATLAMIEAYDMTRSPLLKRSAEKGLQFCLTMQNPYKAWRYGVADGQNDMSVTGWMVMVLKAAKSAQLPFDERAMTWAKEYVTELTDEESGRVGYLRAGELTVREPSKKEEFPAEESEAMTAAGICSRIFAGENPRESRDIQLGVENLLLKKMPIWDQAKGSIDMYYWYYGTLALYQVGGKSWKKWNAAMSDAIIETQRSDGDARGSWDPSGAWGESGGRVYSTALMTMCLEVYYRYGRVFGTK